PHDTRDRARCGDSLCVAFGYLPYEEVEPPSPALRELVASNKWPTLIGGDENAHNLMWGSTNNNPRGECLMDFILENDMTIRNRGRAPTFMNKVRGEIIDLTLTNKRFTDEVVDWRVLDQDSFSDHRYISFEVTTSVERAELKRNPRKTYWAVFEQKVKDLFVGKPVPVVKSKEDLDNITDLVTGKLSEFYEVSCP
ncbi:hypothetical protein, partial [Streptomyces sp. IBSBF 2390]|uniref:hypothetical protein n=1 Tax=Streptomyces sp. IBSBF 2390 TaxID=2903533 RepID=UPI002FDC2044